jgi:hypothetical protein
MTRENSQPWFIFTALLIALFFQGLMSSDTLAQSRHLEERRINRALVAKDAIRHQQMKRAYVAGAIQQHRRERIRDHYEDRIRRERYYAHQDRYRDDDNDNTLTHVLIGAAIGAVATSVIMNNANESDRR